MPTRTSFRQRVVAGDRVLGTVVASPDLALAEVLAHHFDFLWIDLEHSALTLRDVQSLCIAAQNVECATLVRLTTPLASVLPAVLDIGVDGVIAPRVEAVEVAKRFASSLRYPPAGTRGFAHRRASLYGLEDNSRSYPIESPLCFLQLESRRAIERAQDLSQVDGVDGLILGPNDFSLDLGISLGLSSSEVREAMATVQRHASSSQIISGLAAGGDFRTVAGLLGEASTLLAYSADMRIYSTAIQATAHSISAAWLGRSRWIDTVG